ncbi:hypothetical protein [Streptomyces sp. NPDC086766]|uniref:hypothetical protein n=1 Tax=Streptomyces sp. NPDC086766 TaxID=3365754 RepID=UPI0037F28EF1
MKALLWVNAATVWGAAAIISFGALTGCGHHSVVRSTPVIHELTGAQQARIDQAELRIVKGCMARHGFRYWVTPPVPAEDRPAFEAVFVRDDIAWARKHGFGGLIQQRVMAAKARDPNATYRKNLPSAEQVRYSNALGGGPQQHMQIVRLPAGGRVATSTDGCMADATKKLYGDAAAWFHANKIVTNLNPLYVPKLVRDKRFTTALTSWSRCMRHTTGHPYTDPDAVQSDLVKRTAGMSPAQSHPVEVRLAVAEATCAHTSSLSATIHKLARVYSAPVRKRYAKEIETRGRMQHAALARADQVLG